MMKMECDAEVVDHWVEDGKEDGVKLYEVVGPWSWSRWKGVKVYKGVVLVFIKVWVVKGYRGIRCASRSFPMGRAGGVRGGDEGENRKEELSSSLDPGHVSFCNLARASNVVDIPFSVQIR